MTIVFVDTSILLGKWEDPNLQKILQKSRDDEIVICIPKIVKNEWYTNIRDDAFHTAHNTLSTLQSLGQKWDGDLLLKEHNILSGYSHSITLELINQKALELVERRIKENKIREIEVDLCHFQNVFDKYFRWESPFYNDPLNRTNQASRDARKKQIPDGIIVEIINATSMQVEDDIYFLHDNAKDFERAIDKKIKQFAKPDKLLDAIQNKNPLPPVAPKLTYISAESPGKEFDNKVEETLAKHHLEDFLQNLNSIENDLSQKIMGYVKWFAPLEKAKLESLLSKSGFSPQQIEINARRLSSAGVIRDTGYHYLPENNDLNQEAANSVMAEVLKIIDDGGDYE
jgi:hypothetical protein